MMLAYPPGNLDEVAEAGFDWFKYFAYWDAVDGNRDRVYNWDTVDWRLNEACEHGLNLLLRVERDSTNWTPIQDHEMAGWEAFFADLAAHVAGEIGRCSTPYRVAFEVWNEPNLDFQWGYKPVDPARYTRMVQAAYRGAKAGNPDSLIVAGSLAPTGGTGDGRAMDDVAFLQAMYGAGLKGHFDAISIHNYGFGGAPEDKDHGWGILNFRRAEDIYAVMVAHGDGDLPVWGTEFGWLLESTECNGYWDQIGFAWQQVSAAQQADYLTRAFAYADANWPWMEVMIVSNLDFSTLPWYQTCDPLRWFSVLAEDGNPRPAYTALAQMEKRPRAWGSWGMAVAPATLSWMQPLSDTQMVSRAVTVINTGESAFNWTATVADSPLDVSLTPASGSDGDTFTVAVDPRGLPAGSYATTITLTTAELEVPESPLAVPVRFCLAARIHGIYLPAVQRQ